MASLEVGVVAGGKGCSSPPPPPYSAQVEEDEAGRRKRVPLPLHSKEMVVGDVVQDERRRPDENTKLLVVPSDDQKPLLGRNLLVREDNDNDVARSRKREGAFSVVHTPSSPKNLSKPSQCSSLPSTTPLLSLPSLSHCQAVSHRHIKESYRAIFCKGDRPVSSAARISALEEQLRAAATAAVAADFAAVTAAAAAAHKIELLEHKLSAQATIFELKLAAAEDSATKSTRIARLEERINVASLRAELSALKNPAKPGQRKNFSS